MAKRVLRTVPAALLMTTALSWNLSACAQSTGSGMAPARPASTAPAGNSPYGTRSGTPSGTPSGSLQDGGAGGAPAVVPAEGQSGSMAPAAPGVVTPGAKSIPSGPSGTPGMGASSALPARKP